LREELARQPGKSARESLLQNAERERSIALRPNGVRARSTRAGLTTPEPRESVPEPGKRVPVPRMGFPVPGKRVPPVFQRFPIPRKRVPPVF
jgi:hypothetical protein